MNNEIVQSKPKFSAVISSDNYKRMINNTLGDPERAKRFVASITSAVATNPALQECEPATIVSGALLGEALNLSPSPQLGLFYLVPYKNSKKGTTEAQFTLGYKGYIQLAIRSGQYKDIDVIEVKEGEFKGRDKQTGKLKFEFIEDEVLRLTKPTIGYLGYFELLNGFYKQVYMSKEEMEIHANTYSKAFNLEDYKKLQAGQIPEKDLWKYSSFWYKDFSTMAFKTVLRRLISKYGIMSIEMQDAYAKDMAVMKEDGTYDYVDSPEDNSVVMEAKVEENPKKEDKTSKKVNLTDIEE
jgi:recombination protein RecT